MKINYSIYPTLLDSFYWYKKIPTEEKLMELVNKINRVKSPMPIAALKGVQFEDCVNRYIKKEKFYLDKENNVITENFKFNADLIAKIGNKLSRAEHQQKYVEAVLKTDVGNVKVCGFIDYTFPKMYVDLKTTYNYKIGKFKNNNQHKCYPLIAKELGNPIDQFNYVVTDFNRMYIETYDCTDKILSSGLDTICEFISFVEYHKELITDKKIFGL